MKHIRLLIIFLGLIILWQCMVWITGVPRYILPGPALVAKAMVSHWPLLLKHTGVTLLEIVSGLVLGTLFGVVCALGMILSRTLKLWMLPVLVISQAIPVFALAPILVLWLGYGLSSKILMTVLVIFFPVTAALYDGLRRTNPDQLELARVMGGSKIARLRMIRIPAAMPAFASGLRVAAAIAPIGAVIGEWVGSSEGLGFYMLHANARMQVDVMFAALAVLAASALGIYFLVDKLMNQVVFWKRD
ncbi:MAG: ABC transporter permease [Desulfoplanes sp.]